MNKPARRPGRPILTVVLTAFVALGSVNLAHADRDRDGPERFERRDWRTVKPYRSEHWVLDSRFHHNHYYPALGYSVVTLPPGYLDISVGRSHLFFSAGVWFRPGGRGYIVVEPPPGVYLPILPPDYSTLWIGNAPYYYANGVYYATAPTGGYVVIAPPPGAQVTMEPTPPSSGVPAPFPPGAEDGLIVYPGRGQSAAQMAADRAECARWAVSQTGFDPARSLPNDARWANFQRAASACLEAHGYTVR